MSSITQPVTSAFTSLSSATTGTGSVLDAGGFTTNVAFLAGAQAGSGTVNFEASWDNTNWVLLSSWNATGNGTIQAFSSPARYFRARVLNTLNNPISVLILAY